MLKRTKLLSYFREHDRAYLLGLFALVGFVYLPFLGNPFVFDDISFFLGGVAKSYSNSWFHFQLRWLPYASLGWTGDLFSYDVPPLFHLGNLLLHLANVALLFYFLRLIISAVMPEYKNSPALTWGAWFGAVIFACHPVAVYAVGYVAQRSILMATFFGLLMFWAYLRGTQSGEKRWIVLSVVSYFFACFSKEHSALLPLVLAAMSLLLRHSNKLDRRTVWLAWSSYGFVFILIVFIARGVWGTPYEPMAAQLFEQQDVVAGTPLLHLLSVMTQAGLFFKYLFLWLVPNPAWMSVDMREQFMPSLSAWQAWLGLVAFLAYGVFALRLLLRGGSKGLVGFALLYPWLLFLLEFSSIRVQESFVLYRSYLWMPGMTLLVPLMLIRFPGRRIMLALGLVVLMLLPLTWNRLLTFSDNFRLWNDAAKLLNDDKVPGADRIFFSRGRAEVKAEKWKEAAEDFKRAVVIRPDLALIHSELGKAYLNLKDFPNALTQFEAGIAIDPNIHSLYYGKGLALMGMGDFDHSQQVLKQSCNFGEDAACLLYDWRTKK